LSSRLLTVGDRAFLVAAARIWNSLPISSLPHLLWQSSGAGLKLTCLTFPTPVIVQCLCSDSSCFGHYNPSCLLTCLLTTAEAALCIVLCIAYRVLNGMAPPYLNQLVPVSSVPGRRRLRSSFTLQLYIPVPPYRLSTVGRRSSPVAAFIFGTLCQMMICAVCTVCLFLPTTAKDILVSPVISCRFSLNFCTTFSCTLQQFRLFWPGARGNITITAL